MELSAILKRFMERSPIPVMVRALLERILNAERLNACFARVTQKQYTRELVTPKVPSTPHARAHEKFERKGFKIA